MDTMYFSWQELPVEIDPGVQLPQFALEGKILYDCSQNYTAGHPSVLHFFLARCPTVIFVLTPANSCELYASRVYDNGAFHFLDQFFDETKD